jgi:hypothetical protein
MALFEVRELERDELKQWDALVASSPHGTVFQTSDWLINNAILLDRTLVVLGCYDDEVLIGGCPLFLSNLYKLLQIASSTVPLTPYGGMVVSEIDNAKQRKRELHNNKVIAAIREYIIQKRFDYVTLVHSPGLNDIRDFTSNGWASRVYYTYILPIDEDFIDQTSRNVRRNIRKAQQLGIHVTRHFDTDMYWDLTVKTFERQNMQPYFPKKLLVGLLNMIKDKNLGEMWVASMPSGEIAAADIILYDSKTAHRWAATSSGEQMYSGAISLLISEIIDDLKSHNYKSLNMMAGNMAHLSAFASSFSPDLVPYYGVEFSRARYDILGQIKKLMS